MIVRVVLAVACSVVAFTFTQLRRNNYDRQNHSKEEERNDGKEIYAYADLNSASKEEAEEVKRVSTFSPAVSCKSFQENDQLLLPELDDIFLGGLDFPSDSEKSIDRSKLGEEGIRVKYESDESVESKKYESNSEDDEALDVFEALASSNKRISKLVAKPDSLGIPDSEELAQLRAVVAELKEKEMKLESELLEYYGLKEQEKNYQDLERELRKKNVEIEKLNSKLSSLEDQTKKMSEELVGMENLKKELEAARAKIKDLQKMIQSDAGQTKAHLLILKQQVATLQEREQEASKKDFEMERKLQTLKELEVEVVELRRTSKELQHQKRELTVQLAAAEAKVAEVSSLTETELVARVQSEAATLRVTNEDLSKQVEGLQMNRFSEVEELVYLRWVNACLRYELRNYQAPPGKLTALDLGKSLSPKSQEKAKLLMLEYAGPDLLATKAKEQSEQDYDYLSSLPSTPSEYGEFDDSSFDSLPARNNGSKKSSGLIRKLKKWGRNKEDMQVSPASSSLDYRSTPGRMPSPGHRYSGSKGPLENILLRNTSDSVAITSYGTNELDNMASNGLSDALGNLTPIRTRPSVDNVQPMSNVAASFELMSKSVAGVLEDKYPAFKDRHKLALEREKGIKEKADQARAEKLAGKFKTEPTPLLSTDKGKAGRLPDKLKPDRLSQRGADVVSASDQNPERPEVQKMKLSEIQKRDPRVARPPPKSSAGRPPLAGSTPNKTPGGAPPVPPPPPPRAPGGPPLPPPPPGSLMKSQGPGGDKVQRAPEVVEFYQSLMRREARKDTAVGAADGNVSDMHNNMIGEIENRSTFLLAVKADVETQGEFVQSLATEVRNAAYNEIEDVAAFVSWLDEELSFLVDERAVLKHFDWPESKADALREASFEYQDLKKLEAEISSFQDERRLPCEASLKKMLSLLEKVEQSVYALLRTRDMAISRYKEFSIPTQWMLDSGLIGKIKLATVQLARKYMKRVASELDASAASPEKEPQREFMLLQGVRFAFRVHQFAGGFDSESMRTFEELRDRVRAHSVDQSANDKSVAS